MSESTNQAHRDADWAPLGDMEFGSIPELYEFAEFGRRTAAASGLIVLQAAFDLKHACLTIPVMDGRPNGKAQRATRPLKRAAQHLHAAQVCFAKVPRVFLATYEQEIAAMRNRSRKAGIDLGRAA